MDSILNLSSNEEQRDISCVKQTLVAHYHQILRGTIDDEGNYKINTGRADKIQLGIILMVIGYVVLFISTIVLTMICDKEEADNYAPFNHVEYEKTLKKARLKFDVHDRIFSGIKYWNDPDYLFDWTEGEFS